MICQHEPDKKVKYLNKKSHDVKRTLCNDGVQNKLCSLYFHFRFPELQYKFKEDLQRVHGKFDKHLKYIYLILLKVYFSFHNHQSYHMKHFKYASCCICEYFVF